MRLVEHSNPSYRCLIQRTVKLFETSNAKRFRLEIRGLGMFESGKNVDIKYYKHLEYFYINNSDKFLNKNID